MNRVFEIPELSSLNNIETIANLIRALRVISASLFRGFVVWPQVGSL